jgi:anti-sigma regulatory factor (Ser/Thr protein kinase)
MTSSAMRVFEARRAQLADAIDFAEDFCRLRGVGHVDAMRLLLVVEELFTNTIEHGHGGDCSAPIGVQLDASAAGLSLLYEDAAPPFDVLAHQVAHPPGADPVEGAAPVGGLGIPLVVAFAASARYAYQEGRNRLWIVLRREAAAV